MDIAQSAARSAWLLEESAAFCHAAGFIESNDPNATIFLLQTLGMSHLNKF